MAPPLDYATRMARRTSIQKQATPVPPTSATDRFMAAIAKHQVATPGLSFLEASNQVVHDQPDLHEAYVWEVRHPGQPQPLAKQADAVVTPEAIVKAARTRAVDNATSCRTELLTMCKEYEGTPHYGVVAEAWRRYHISDAAVNDWYAERLAPPQTGSGR